VNKPLNNREAMVLEAMGDLRKTLEFAQEIGNVEFVDGADPELEIGALYELSLEEEFPPVLIFRNIKGYPPGHRVAVNVRGSKVFDNGEVGLERVQVYRKHRRKKADPIPPVVVTEGPVLENVLEGSAINVNAFPAPNGTRTMAAAISALSAWSSLAIPTATGSISAPTGCRCMTRPRSWCSSSTASRRRHPPQILGARRALPDGDQCRAVAGAGRGRAFDARAKRVGIRDRGLPDWPPDPGDQGPPHGISDSSRCRAGVRGFMPPPEEVAVPEGPFGEWPGYYASSTRPEPVLQVKAIYHRNDPIIVGAPPMKPTKPAFHQGIAGSSYLRAAALWDELEAGRRARHQGRVEDGGRRAALHQCDRDRAAARRPRQDGGLVAAGCGSNSYLGRIVIVVDDDIDITSSAEVMWALATRWDPKTQTDIIDGMWTGYIDPTLHPERREAHDLTNSRIIIYAVRPFAWKDEFPKVNTVSAEYADKVRAKWKDSCSSWRGCRGSNEGNQWILGGAYSRDCRELRRRAPHGSLPPCGGGTGRGVAAK
jgi:4-hydroxy-3-polyprenylbenzoate decarboxylase